MPEEYKDKCPVCNVTIGCNEKVQVLRARDTVGLESDKKVREDVDIGWKQEMIVKGKMRERLSPVDVAIILYLVNLRDSWDNGKKRIGICLASGTKALTELYLNRLVFFLTHMPQYKDDGTERKIARELHVFNIRHGTNFSLGDLRTVVSSPKDLPKILRLAKALKYNKEKVPEVSPQQIEL